MNRNTSENQAIKQKILKRMLQEMERLAQSLEDTGHEPPQSFYNTIKEARDFASFADDLKTQKIGEVK